MRPSVVGTLLVALTVCGNSAFGQAQPAAGATTSGAVEKPNGPGPAGGSGEGASTAQPPSRPAGGHGQGAGGAKTPSTKWATGASAKMPAAKDSSAPGDLPSAEELIAAALQNNPDVLVAESKVREAEAERNRARLQVVRQVITLRESLQNQRSEVAGLRALYQTGTVQQKTISAALTELADFEAQLDYLLGKQPQGTGQPHGMLMTPMGMMARPMGMGGGGVAGGIILKSGMGSVGGDAVVVLGGTKLARPDDAIADSIRKALDKTVAFEFIETPFSEAVHNLREQGGVTFLVDKSGLKDAGVSLDSPITLQMTEVQLGAALQAFADLHRPMRFVVRDYGVLITAENSIPQDGVLLRDFWKPAEKESSDARK